MHFTFEMEIDDAYQQKQNPRIHLGQFLERKDCAYLFHLLASIHTE